MAASFIGGQSFSRDFKGGEKGRDPIVPISGSKQREALKLLVDKILSDQAFKFSPSLLRRLTTEHWYHWGSDSFSYGGGVNYPIYDRILAIQRIVLNQCYDGTVLSRILNQELQVDEGANPIRISEIFRSVTDGVWSELATGSDAKDVTLTTVRRNLQREHIRRLANMVLGSRRSSLEDLYAYVVIMEDRAPSPRTQRASPASSPEIGIASTRNSTSRISRSTTPVAPI